MDQFGRRLRTLRENSGFTQAYVAERANKKEPNYRKLERGDIAMPTPLTIVKLASAFDMTAEEFLAELSRINLNRPTSLEERDRLQRVIEAVERVHWTEDREAGVRGLLDRWKRIKSVR